ncbi:flagellar hook protein FlgE [Inmirania thermothiophila]|uniref:Flagellar hook protein FlgE n=1 Tax=Inmirania thermothiophila TaxID=1750597 RepID=A0A3N1Y7W0_9GAMM|nr:flagellar hook protein FlgE [Inmirania thermothiophila]ROR34909.1 flagellar hook protein FlgE [Inmirania thermothiophila]
MAFEIALTGLNAASAELSVIGNNIANAGTTGFKQSRPEFADIFAVSNLGTTASGIGQGVRLSGVAQQFTQGNITFTDNPLDLAISGEGFFRLSDNGAITYTRAGAFRLDNRGFVVNGQGQRLTAFQADSAGNITGALGDLQISTANIPPQATSQLDALLNLDANATVFGAGAPAFNHNDPTTFNHATSTTVYDTLGNPLLATMYFRKVGANSWQMHTWVTQPDGTEVELVPAGGSPGSPATLTFDNTGRLTATSPAGSLALSVDYDPATLTTGGAPLDMDIVLSGTTQFGADFAVSSLSQDGFATGRLTSIDIEDNGIVFARFSNGQSSVLGQVALATFANPQGLRPVGDTAWAESFASGPPLVAAPGSGTLGLIQSGALEESNVEISEQLVRLITAQRNFQANAQVVTTADQVTQAILNIR